MRKEDIKTGQDMTIVSKGIRHNTYSEGTFIDETQVGRTSFIQVAKIGIKYVYGKHFHFEDGKRELFQWEDRVNLEEVLVFDGVRQDLQEAYNKKRLECEAYETEREKAHYEIDREMHDLMRAKQEEWDKAHSRPKPLDLTALPYINMTHPFNRVAVAEKLGERNEANP